jgi:hypothetical protein
MFKQTVIAKGAEVVLRIPKNLVGKELEITATIKKGKKAAVAPMAPLTDDDWALPGRPATDEELEQLAEAMDRDNESGYTPEEAMAVTGKKIAAWKDRHPM